MPLDGSIRYLDATVSRAEQEFPTAAPPFIPVHATTLGKILLGFQSEQTIAQVIGNGVRLKRFTAYTIVQPQALRDELQRVRQWGYAVSDQESTLGLPLCGRSDP